MVQNAPVDAHVIHELGDISALPRQDEFGGCVVHSVDGRAQFVAGGGRCGGSGGGCGAAFVTTEKRGTAEYLQCGHYAVCAAVTVP